MPIHLRRKICSSIVKYSEPLQRNSRKSKSRVTFIPVWIQFLNVTQCSIPVSLKFQKMNKCSYICVLSQFVVFTQKLFFLKVVFTTTLVSYYLMKFIYRVFINMGAGWNVVKYRTKPAKVVVATMVASRILSLTFCLRKLSTL